MDKPRFFKHRDSTLIMHDPADLLEGPSGTEVTWCNWDVFPPPPLCQSLKSTEKDTDKSPIKCRKVNKKPLNGFSENIRSTV